jgi:hypothetical protein
VPLHLPVNGPGIMVDGEARAMRASTRGAQRRVWRKVPLGVDEETPPGSWTDRGPRASRSSGLDLWRQW